MSKLAAIIVACLGLTVMSQQEAKADEIHLQFGRFGICVPVTPSHHYNPHCRPVNPHYNHRPVNPHYNRRPVTPHYNHYNRYHNNYNHYNHYNRYHNYYNRCR